MTASPSSWARRTSSFSSSGVPKRDEAGFAWLVCFFELACAISGYMSGVNPFDQPGVEAYKKNMFALLGKPGYEDRKAELEAKLTEKH